MISFNRVKEILFKEYSKDPGKMLLHTATLGWIFSAMGQIFGIVNNDKVSSDQKKFLIPQEMADAAVNIACFYFLTDKIQNLAKGKVSSGKLLTPEIKQICKRFNIPTELNGKSLGKMIQDKIKHLGKTPEAQELNSFYNDKYAPFENGVKLIGNVTGGIISSNIITPLLRNSMASAKQKHDINKENTQDEKSKPFQRIILGQNKMDIEDYKKQSCQNVLYRTPSSSMKV